MKLKFVHIVFAAVLALVSCTKQDRENTIISQEASIDSYIGTVDAVEVVRNGGSNRVVISSGKEGTAAVAGDSLHITYAGYIFSRGKGTMFATNSSDVASLSGYPVQVSPFKLKLGSTDLIEGLDKGLEGVKEGEHCYIIFSAKYGFNNTVVYNIPKLSPLFFEVWVDKVIK